MEDLRINWSELKTAHGRNFPLFYMARTVMVDEVPHDAYTVFGVEHERLYIASVEGTTNVSDFETNFKSGATSVSGRDAVVALIPPPTNSQGAVLVEMTPKLSPKRTLTIVSHDFSEPTTWWQNSTKVTNEALTDSGSGVFTSAHPIWINAEHPKLFADEPLDAATWAADGYAGYPAPQESYYLSWWQPDATMKLRYFYYPIIQVQPGGTGAWVTADPASVAAAPNYSYTIDYTAGVVHFNSQTSWPVGTLVRATYFWAAQTKLGSTFEIGPPAGKIWLYNKTKVQLSVGAAWRDSVVFLGKEGGVVGLIGHYRTYGQMQATATKSWTTNGGVTANPQAWPASEENGWMYGGAAGMRNHTKALENNLWEYDRPFELRSSLQDRITLMLAHGQSFLDADEADVTLHIDEHDE